MASYNVVPKSSVEKDLRALPKTVIARVLKQMEALGEDPFPRRATKLEGGEGLFRVRVGDYRIVYSVDQNAKQIIVHYIRHRREVYRRLK
jgi:mRNA interferase RelE/StbE